MTGDTVRPTGRTASVVRGCAALVFALATCGGAVAAGRALAQDPEETAPGIHLQVGGMDVFATPAMEDYSYMLFDLCDAMGFGIRGECDIYPMNGLLA